jgi:hypothetical protein
MSNIFLAFAILISAPGISVKDIVPFAFFARLATSDDDWEGPDNFSVVLGLDAKLGGSDFKGLLLGDGAVKENE